MRGQTSALAVVVLLLGSLIPTGCAERPTAPVVTNPSFRANVAASTVSGYAQVSAGSYHSCAVRTDGSLVCWGANGAGQTTPPAGNNFAQVSAGGYHTCALRTDGSIACWGWNQSGQATAPTETDFTQLSAGGQTNCAIRMDASMACWGNNNNGLASPPAGTFIQVSVGGLQACAVRTDGSLICWGDNAFGQTTPPSGNNFEQVSSGGSHICALRTSGSLVCWGYDGNGQASPPTGNDFDQVDAGGSHNCARRTAGSLLCWGWNNDGQTTAPTGTDFVQVSAGGYHTCALRTNHSLTCWGDNEFGEATPPSLPVTPQDAIQLLMNDVRTLVSEGMLSVGQGNGLLAKLTAAIPSLSRDRTNATCNQLGAFVNQANALVRAGKLLPAAGHNLTTTAESIRLQIGCGSAACPLPAQGNRVLVDASHDGGGWWFPQTDPFSPDSYHQGQALADYLRGKGYVVQELPRGAAITDSLLLASKIVIRATVFGSYTSTELQAYQHFLACPRTLLLLGDYLSDGSQDLLAEMLGVKFTGIVSGYVTTFAAHPITSGVVPLLYNAGATVAAGYPSTVHILGWLSTGEPVMGVVDHGTANIFFIGDVNGIESVPQPLVDNLINWGF